MIKDHFTWTQPFPWLGINRKWGCDELKWWNIINKLKIIRKKSKQKHQLESWKWNFYFFPDHHKLFNSGWTKKTVLFYSYFGYCWYYCEAGPQRKVASLNLIWPNQLKVSFGSLKIRLWKRKPANLLGKRNGHSFALLWNKYWLCFIFGLTSIPTYFSVRHEFVKMNISNSI